LVGEFIIRNFLNKDGFPLPDLFTREQLFQSTLKGGQKNSTCSRILSKDTPIED